jgi:hypothetical protein
MTAVVAAQNIMSCEYEKELSFTTTSNNDITQSNGSEFKLQENVNSQPSLEAMGLQPEAEEEDAAEAKIVENLSSPKGSTKRKTDNHQRTLCEELLGEVSQSQQEAIERISTPEGLKQMNKWLVNARDSQQNKHLCILLAQCFMVS